MIKIGPCVWAGCTYGRLQSRFVYNYFFVLRASKRDIICFDQSLNFLCCTLCEKVKITKCIYGGKGAIPTYLSYRINSVKQICKDGKRYLVLKMTVWESSCTLLNRRFDYKFKPSPAAILNNCLKLVLSETRGSFDNTQLSHFLYFHIKVIICRTLLAMSQTRPSTFPL